MTVPYHHKVLIPSPRAGSSEQLWRWQHITDGSSVGQGLPILRTCQKAHGEARMVLYGSDTFYFDDRVHHFCDAPIENQGLPRKRYGRATKRSRGRGESGGMRTPSMSPAARVHEHAPMAGEHWSEEPLINTSYPATCQLCRAYSLSGRSHRIH